ncbi:MAG TPA: tRNA (adenosine(37)-N6)-dimethylallyltransferase MiaA, partial [Dehalococcoidia bacterium]|nr:tRNA (adenosine(37)-N6)-dimethylallyltransferase MiaA [Dehalococcoidia bacterium]
APPDFDALTIALTLDRAALYARVDRRAEAMFERGLLAEVAALLADGYDPDAPAFSSIGYREAIACLRGDLSPAAALDRLKFGTHRYIRQQDAWLRRQADVHWTDAIDPVTARSDAIRLIEGFLAGEVTPRE